MVHNSEGGSQDCAEAMKWFRLAADQGDAEAQFVDDGLDKIRWALRQVYFRQRNYFFKNERYTASLKKLNLMGTPVEGVPWPPKIMVTPSGWEAELVFGDRSMYIRKDGRVWE